MATSLRRCALVAAIAFFGISGCDRPRPPEPTLQIGVTDSMTHLDPARGIEPATTVVSRFAFQTLPQIAKAIRRSKDGRTWTFTIASRLRFDDGTPLDANAFVANVVRWRSGWFDSDGFLGFARAFLDPRHPNSALVDVRALDATTVRIRTRGPVPELDRMLADPHFAIGSPAAFGLGDEHFDAMPVGSGPYTIVRSVPGTYVELAPVPGRGRYASVFVHEIVDPFTSVLALDKGDLMVVYGFPSQYLADAERLDLPAMADPATGLWCAFARSVLQRERRCPPTAQNS